MAWRPPQHCGRSFLFSLFFLLAAVHGAGAEAPAPAAPAPRLPPAEARALAAKLGVTQWDLGARPCDDPAAGVDCQCSSSASNQTVCHAVRIVLNGRNFSGELPPDFADLPYLQHLDLSLSLFHGGVPHQWAQMKLKLLFLMGNRLAAISHGSHKDQNPDSTGH
ncbi:unnamed protein product [Urochloa humidicola]